VLVFPPASESRVEISGQKTPLGRNLTRKDVCAKKRKIQNETFELLMVFVLRPNVRGGLLVTGHQETTPVRVSSPVKCSLYRKRNQKAEGSN
jgi:hypothetical protein